MNAKAGNIESKLLKRISQIRDAAGTILFIDEHEDSISDTFFEAGYHRNDRDGSTATYWWSWPTARHLGAGSISFVDGHTETRKRKNPRTLFPVNRKRYELRDRGFETIFGDNLDRTWMLRRFFQDFDR